ncbi:apolipoprotein N-acyltransferase [Actinorugispora endophytica]|uniref:Apolipoprotein N-acyltransferase n=1 Tax=Actinorugispora endophytica TaxID=1605990 RepID=A0A4R6V2J2_9ACTN|nr:nitrilase-related carbon-nitrogen hydrolase [Actinorugispora endophytica]TDQ52304.1 apolipoprotein N-acyltransferase [Actinorugispora endophytica]
MTTTEPAARARVAPSAFRRGAWLLAGTALSLFAMQAVWDIALVAWVYPVLLLRFTRTGGTPAAVAGIWASTALAMLCWLHHADLLSAPILVITLPLAAAQAVPFLVDRFAAPRLESRGLLLSALVFPATKAAVEFAVASATPFGTIYGVLGATQHGNLPLIQTASVTGVYGVSFLVAWAASTTALLWDRGLLSRPARTAAACCAGALGLVMLAGGARLAFAPPSAETVRIAGVTTSVPAWEELVPTFREYDSLEKLLDADPELMREEFAAVNGELLANTEREAEAGARIVVWPESAAFTLESGEDRLIADIQDVARRHGVYVDAGMSVYTERAPHIRNMMVMVTPDGEVAWKYDKSRPIPVLEPYDAGPGVLPVEESPFGRLSNVICYDADFPGLLRQGGAAGADIMIVGANTWEGIKEMHARNSVFRAVENGFSVFRQASRGRANAVDHQGRPLATTDYFTTDQQTMVAFVPTRGVTTVYSVVGDLFAWLCVVTVVLLAALCALPRRRGGSTPGDPTGGPRAQDAGGFPGRRRLGGSAG